MALKIKQPLTVVIEDVVTIFMLLTFLLKPVESQGLHSDWLKRPGTLPVCEGDNVTLQWQYNPGLGEFYLAQFWHLTENVTLVVTKRGEYPTELHVPRVRLVEGTNSGITLTDTRLSDSGAYDIDLYFNGFSVRRTDQAQLHVLSECPNRTMYIKPRVSFTSHMARSNSSDSIRRFHNSTLMVALPPANPPVTCTIINNHRNVTCNGRSDRMEICSIKLPIMKENILDFTITFSFFIWEPSVNRLSVRLGNKVWPLRPGTVYVCERHPVSLLWKYDTTIGIFDAVSFYKTKPERQLLVSKVSGEPPRRHSDWDLLDSEGGYLEMINTYTKLSDKRTFEIEVNFDMYTKLIYDQADLKLLRACPDRGRYKHPQIWYKSTNDTKKSTSSKRMIIYPPCIVTLIVVLPAADPPVTCTVAVGSSRYTCVHAEYNNTECQVELYFNDNRHQQVTVTLTFVALEPTITDLQLVYPGLPGKHVFENQAQDSSQNSNSTLTIIGVAVALVLVIGIIITILYRKRHFLLCPDKVGGKHGVVSGVLLLCGINVEFSTEELRDISPKTETATYNNPTGPPTTVPISAIPSGQTADKPYVHDKNKCRGRDPVTEDERAGCGEYTRTDEESDVSLESESKPLEETDSWDEYY